MNSSFESTYMKLHIQILSFPVKQTRRDRLSDALQHLPSKHSGGWQGEFLQESRQVNNECVRVCSHVQKAIDQVCDEVDRLVVVCNLLQRSKLHLCPHNWTKKVPTHPHTHVEFSCFISIDITFILYTTLTTNPHR